MTVNRPDQYDLIAGHEQRIRDLEALPDRTTPPAIDFYQRTVWGWKLAFGDTNIGAEVKNMNAGHYWTPIFDPTFAVAAPAETPLGFGWYLESTDTEADVIFPFWMPKNNLGIRVYPLRSVDGGGFRADVATWDYDAASYADFNWIQIPFDPWGLIDCVGPGALEAGNTWTAELLVKDNPIITRGDAFETLTIGFVDYSVWNGSPGPMALRITFDQPGTPAGGTNGWIVAVSFDAGAGVGAVANHNDTFIMHDQP